MIKKVICKSGHTIVKFKKCVKLNHNMDNEQFSQEFAHLNNSILNMDDDIYEFHKMVSTDEIDNIIGEQTDFFKNGDKD